MSIKEFRNCLAKLPDDMTIKIMDECEYYDITSVADIHLDWDENNDPFIGIIVDDN